MEANSEQSLRIILSITHLAPELISPDGFMAWQACAADLAGAAGGFRGEGAPPIRQPGNRPGSQAPS